VIIAYFLFILILSLTNNYPILLHFRLVDILILSAFLLFLKYCRISFRAIVSLMCFFSLALASSIVNESSGANLVEMVFYYKYLFFMISILLVRGLIFYLDEQDIRCHYRKNHFAFISLVAFLIVYVFIFVADNMTMAVGGMTRVSIPFSSFEEGASNSPSFSLIFALIFIYMDKSVQKYSIIIMVFSVIALLLCGSRTGVFAIFLYYLLFRSWNIKFTFGLLMLVMISTPILIHYMSGDSLVSGLLERAVNFELSSDDSANGRVSKQLEAFSSTEKYYYLLGVGHENTSILWYDGLIGNLQVFSGILGVIFFYTFYLDVRLKGSYFIFFDIILMTSFISEFVLISYVVGFAFMLTLLLKFNLISHSKLLVNR